jgi:hypothetical protein
MTATARAFGLALLVLVANYVVVYASFGVCDEVSDPQGLRGAVCAIPFAGDLIWLLATPAIILALGLAGRPVRDVTRATLVALALAGGAFIVLAIAAS